MIKLFKYFLPALSALLLSHHCNAALMQDSTQDEKVQAKIKAMVDQLTDSVKKSKTSDEEAAADNTYTGPTGQENYLRDSIKKHDFNKKDWKEVTKGLTYNEKSEKPKPEKHHTNIDHSKNSGSMFQMDSSLGQMILIIVVAALLGFALFKIFSGQVSNTKVGAKKSYRIEEIEDALHESDLERYLREAIANKEFRMAVRIYYLMAIKALSERGWIKWKKDKTNNQYLAEMSMRPDFPGFRDITRLFEFTWYGEMTVNEKHFQLLDPKFRAFLNQVNTPSAK